MSEKSEAKSAWRRRIPGLIVISVLVIVAALAVWGWLRPHPVKTVEVTREVTKVVERTVVVKETVVVHATPVPATPTMTLTPSVTPTPTVTQTATVSATSGPDVGRVEKVVSGEFHEGWSEDWFRSPFTQTTDSLPITATIETFAEPGVLLDDTAAFDHMSASDTPILVPEGGFSYIAIGAVSLTHNGGQLNLYHEERNIYLVVIRGLPDDNGPADLNQIVLARDYVRATGIYSPMPSGSYVSLGWTIQQIQASFRDPNCGGTGCQQATVVVVDLQTHSYRLWVVKDPKSPRTWVHVD